ncbi:MAG: serine acetyltransferase [Oscillospiraceae bacterium]|jgi:serine O-acetyltransferase|nr:serine acetyltransferase [Oscillospiraceae bacterium]
MSTRDEIRIHKIVNRLSESYRAERALIKIDARDQINRETVIGAIEDLRQILFAGFFARKPLRWESLEYHVGELTENLIHNLSEQIGRALLHRKDENHSIAPQNAYAPGVSLQEVALDITYTFLERQPEIRALLATDVEAAFDGDPAAYNRDEIILSYPGVFAIMVNRLAHELYLLGVPLVPRMMSEHAHGVTGIDIHPGATIGHHFFIDHGTGIVIGETTNIGNCVKIYQGVTLGGLSTRGGQQLSQVKRHPTIEDDVTIYSGASILGGGTVIGEGVVIGANTFITKSVPKGTRVSIRNPELQFRAGENRKNVELSQDEAWFYTI